MQVLRTAFLALLLGNLLLFLWGQGRFGTKGGEPERLAAQIEPDKIRLVSIGEPPRALAPPAEECRYLANLDAGAATRLAAMVAARDAELKITRYPQEEPRLWWVFIPPLPNAAQADKKAAELSRLRIRDFYVVREAGPNQFALSLGLFRSEKAANEYLEVLQKKGVRSARVLPRESASEKNAVELRGPADRLDRVLAELAPELALPPPTACPKP